MKWRGRRKSSNVTYSRGGGGRGGGFRLPGGLGRGGGGIRLPGGFGRSGGSRMRRAGGGGIGMIVVFVVAALALNYCAGIDLTGGMLGGGGQVVGQRDPGIGLNPTRRDETVTRGETASRDGAGDPVTQDELDEFIAVVLAETEDTWNGIFRSQGRDYPEPRLEVFEAQVRSACGLASSATGPFYCPGDSKVYLDTAFFRTLSRQFGARGDFANAYVIAHEVGHHVQNVIGVLPRFNQMRARLSEAQANQMSVRVELQADCFAGIWAHNARNKGLLEEGDLDEALNAAVQIGDDAIQRRTQGYVVPETFNHGTSEQRREWFLRGYQSGRVTDCDTQIFG